ncbi:bifunctional nicotinamidase/pyrazinamidase [Geofilum sp. OHC36d9]|uniref:bifunctional nicotinamidase/pyrazinamidase n=1 Tax=Geofilum sp. OHC36d9 TaxID=3458413 RepID=UPI0040345BC9
MQALLLIDIQNDFLPNGALGVPDGDHIIPVINNIQHKFNCIIATRDWHPANHGSFASNHVNKQPGEVIQLNGLTQILWPDHCMQGSPGAELSPRINQSLLSNVIFKGTDPDIDSYSAFYDNGHLKETGLQVYLKRNGITSLYVAGLATDYCVYYTVLDALKLGYATTLITDATKGVNIHPNDSQKAIMNMEKQGAQLTTSAQILND